jgi:hypothetical protein
MKEIQHKFSGIVLVVLFVFSCVNFNSSITNYISGDGSGCESFNNFSHLLTVTPKLAQPTGNFSRYNLSVVLDEANSFIDGNLTVNFYNNDDINFTKIPFHLYLSGMQYETRPGIIEILNVTDVNNPSITLPFEVYSNQQIMWVNISEKLEPQKRVQFIIQFNATIPDGGIDRANSYGSDFHDSRIYKFGSFYPIPCVYDNDDGWNIDPYLDIGDPFYFDMAYYNLSIEVPSQMVIAATGKLEEKINKGSTTFYRFNPIYPVREVTFSASRYFQVESKISNGVNLSVYYLPKDSSIWTASALNYAEQALSLYNNTFGIYPYPTLNVVEEYTWYGGMEYPNQVYITESIYYWGSTLSEMRHYLELIIAHELGHQWWYNLVGNDEIDVGFLDEGITCWSADYYGEYYYGDWEHFQDIPYIQEVRTYFANTLMSSKINQTIYECIDTNTDYWYVAYTKAPLIFEKLRQTIGHSNFVAGLRYYFENYKFKLVVLSDIQQAFEAVVGQSLDWFFFPWFDNPYLPKYSFSEHNYNAATKILNLTIEDINEPLNDYMYSQQVPLVVYDVSGYEIYSQDIWINDTTELSLNLSKNPGKVSLLYNNYVLVQLNAEYDLSLDLIIQSAEILGYDIGIFILLSASLIGLLIVVIKRKVKKLK